MNALMGVVSHVGGAPKGSHIESGKKSWHNLGPMSFKYRQEEVSSKRAFTVDSRNINGNTTIFEEVDYI
jgi:hypothetical protein